MVDEHENNFPYLHFSYKQSACGLDSVIGVFTASNGSNCYVDTTDNWTTVGANLNELASANEKLQIAIWACTHDRLRGFGRELSRHCDVCSKQKERYGKRHISDLLGLSFAVSAGLSRSWWRHVDSISSGNNKSELLAWEFTVPRYSGDLIQEVHTHRNRVGGDARQTQPTAFCLFTNTRTQRKHQGRRRRCCLTV